MKKKKTQFREGEDYLRRFREMRTRLQSGVPGVNHPAPTAKPTVVEISR